MFLINAVLLAEIRGCWHLSVYLSFCLSVYLTLNLPFSLSTDACIHAYMYVCMYVMYVYMYAMYVCMCMYVCTYVHMQCMYVMYVCICVCMYVCACCACMCVYGHMYAGIIYVCDLVRESFFHNLLSCCLLVYIPRSPEWQELGNRFPVSASTVGSLCSVECKPAGSLCSATSTGKTIKHIHNHKTTDCLYSWDRHGKSVRSWCDGSSEWSLMDDPFSYFSFQPVLHNWYVVCAILYVGWCI